MKPSTVPPNFGPTPAMPCDICTSALVKQQVTLSSTLRFQKDGSLAEEKCLHVSFYGLVVQQQ